MTRIKSAWDQVREVLSRLKSQFIDWFDRGNKTNVLFLAPYVITFSIFILMPTLMAILLSLTYFNGIEKPEFVGLDNYIYLLTQDDAFMKDVLPNTLLFSFIVGPGG